MGTNSPVAISSNHTNLRYFMTSRKLKPRQVQWAFYLSSSYFNIFHTPGKLNPADPSSRRTDYASSFSSKDNLITLFTPSQLQEGLTVMSLSTSIASININITFSLPPKVVCLLLTGAYASENALLSGLKYKLYRWQGGLRWFRECLCVPSTPRLTLI